MQKTTKKEHCGKETAGDRRKNKQIQQDRNTHMDRQTHIHGDRQTYTDKSRDRNGCDVKIKKKIQRKIIHRYLSLPFYRFA